MKWSKSPGKVDQERKSSDDTLIHFFAAPLMGTKDTSFHWQDCINSMSESPFGAALSNMRHIHGTTEPDTAITLCLVVHLRLRAFTQTRHLSVTKLEVLQ